MSFTGSALMALQAIDNTNNQVSFNHPLNLVNPNLTDVHLAQGFIGYGTVLTIAQGAVPGFYVGNRGNPATDGTLIVNFTNVADVSTSNVFLSPGQIILYFGAGANIEGISAYVVTPGGSTIIEHIVWL